MKVKWDWYVDIACMLDGDLWLDKKRYNSQYVKLIKF